MTTFFTSQRCKLCCCCCKQSYSLCECCHLCFDCCCCPTLPPLPCLPHPPQCLAPMPPLSCCQSTPIRVIREQVLVPCPYPVYPRESNCSRNECNYDEDDVCRSPCDYTDDRGACSISRKCCEDYHYAIPSYPCRREKPFICLPYPRPKRVHLVGQPVMPGYGGHVPGLRFYGAGRSFGKATKDTRCIMSQWEECCPRLPSRIWEQ